MAATGNGILQRRLDQTPIAVIDFETTGLYAGADRVVEVSVVRIEPGDSPRLALDTLVNPERRVAATHVHGITDRDVAEAPTFGQLIPQLLHAVSGCVIAAHNAYFDLGFLAVELGRSGMEAEVPFVCTRFLRPLLGYKACSLSSACECHRIPFRPAHASRLDAEAAARLWTTYRDSFLARQVETFRALTLQGKRYKFMASFLHEPPRARKPLAHQLVPLKPRSLRD